MEKFYIKKLPAFLIFTLVVLTNILLAQKAKLYGTVTDETDSTMAGVVVAIKGDSVGTQTDTAGKYELEIKPGTRTVEFSFIGYEKRSFLVTVIEKNEKRLDVKMAEKNKELDVVVVTGTKYEKKLGEEITSTEVIKPQMLQQGNLTMNEGMNLVPGVNMLGNSISIRGGGGFADATSNRVLALLDDLPIISPENGSIIWDMVPVEELAQVEIIKGSSSSFFGSSALDGVMNMITVNPQPQMENKLIVSYGFYGQPDNKTWDWNWRTTQAINGKPVKRLNLPMFGGAQFLHTKQYGDFGVVFSAAYNQNQNYLQNAPYTIARFGAKLRYTPHKHPHLTLGLNMNVFYKSFNDFFVAKGVDSSMYQSSVPPPSSNQRTFNIDPYFNYYDDHDNRHTFKFRVFNVVYNSATVPPYSSGDSTNSTQYYLDYTFTHTFRKINMILTTGANGFFTTVTGKTFAPVVQNINAAAEDTRTIKNIAAFIQFEKKFFNNRLILSAGLRAEYAQLADTTVQNRLPIINGLNTMFGGKKDIYSPVTPLARAGLNYQVAEGTFIRGSIGQGFRYPALAEKYIYTLRSGAQVFPNDSLKPENSWTAEIGIKQSVKISKWIAYFDLSGFITRYHNMIEFEYYGNYPNITLYGIPFQAQNVENAQIPGFELSTFANGVLFGVPFNFLVGYTYIYPENLSYNPGDPNATPLLKYRIQNTLKAGIDFNYKGFVYGVNAFYGSYMKYIDNVGIGALGVVTDFRDTHHDGEFVMDMRAGYNYKDKVTFMFICKNILNTEYMLQPGLVEAPRNYTFQVTYNF